MQVLDGYFFYELPRSRVRDEKMSGYFLHAFPATDTVAIAVRTPMENPISTYSRESAIVKTHLDWWAGHFQDMQMDFFISGLLPDEV